MAPRQNGKVATENMMKNSKIFNQEHEGSASHIRWSQTPGVFYPLHMLSRANVTIPPDLRTVGGLLVVPFRIVDQWICGVEWINYLLNLADSNFSMPSPSFSIPIFISRMMCPSRAAQASLLSRACMWAIGACEVSSAPSFMTSWLPRCEVF